MDGALKEDNTLKGKSRIIQLGSPDLPLSWQKTLRGMEEKERSRFWTDSEIIEFRVLEIQAPAGKRKGVTAFPEEPLRPRRASPPFDR